MPNIPPFVDVLLAALRLSDPEPESLARLDRSQWEAALSFCDAAHLTLFLARAHDNFAPEWVQARFARNFADNAQRFGAIRQAYLEMRACFSQAGLEHLVLKGFAQQLYGVEPRERMQGDVDIYCDRHSAFAARDELAKLGYAPLPGFEDSPSDHLPTMQRESNWKWKGNYFDPEIPVSVDLHFQFWHERRTRLRPLGLEGFWSRRVEIPVDSFLCPALQPADAFGYAALHALRHLLHGTMSLHSLYEIALFLRARGSDHEFWTNWASLHDPSLRRLEAVPCLLAARLFACSLPTEMQEEVENLPAGVCRWIREEDRSALGAVFAPNKDAVWLHLSLLESRRDKLATFRDAVFPAQLPTVNAVQAYSGLAPTTERRAARTARYAKYIFSRGLHHVRLLPWTVAKAARWWWNEKGLTGQFLLFLGVSFFYTLGMFLYFFLFNLYLLDCGYREDFLGLVTGGIAAGGMIGTIPAGLMAQRAGLKKTLAICIGLTVLIAVLRTLFIAKSLQLGLAVLAGLVMSGWAVCISPVIAQLTTQRTRPLAFSLVFSSGIGVGVLGGLAGGWLPKWFSIFHALSSPVASERATLRVAACISALAIWPLARLALSTTPAEGRAFYPRNRFLLRFMPAIAIWGLATGTFTPFANVYFSRHVSLPVQSIGLTFSASQLAQVVAILLSPLLFRRLGLVNAIMFTQLATAAALGYLALTSSTLAAVLIFPVYTGLQYMSEPGMYSLLMDRVAPSERSGASAINALVISCTQVLAAALAGAILVRASYPSLLGIAATFALLAAFGSGLLLNSVSQTHASSPLGLGTASQD